MPKVKICRVQDIHTARLCGDLGVDMVGLHGIFGLSVSERHAYKRIVDELRTYYPATLPVLVSKVTDPVELAGILLDTGITCIQLHTPLNPSQSQTLLRAVARRLGSKPQYIAVVASDDSNAISRARGLGTLADWVLVDKSYKGGTGHQVNRETVRDIMAAINPGRILVAGGVTVDNVRDIILEFRPGGVDVQTGVEIPTPSHNKDPIRIGQLVKSAQEKPKKEIYAGHRVTRGRPLVSLSLTSVPERDLDTTLCRFAQTDLDMIHVDFSDASIAPLFRASPYAAVEQLAGRAPCIPYDAHLFVHDLAEQHAILSKCLNRNPMMRSAFVHYTRSQEYSRGHLDGFATMVSGLGVAASVAIQATGYDSSSISSLVDALHSIDLEEISLVTRSRAHRMQAVAEHDLPLLTQLTSYCRGKPGLPIISVDRDINREKLTVLSEGRPNHVIVGAALLTAKNPQRCISTLRSLLTCPEPGQT